MLFDNFDKKIKEAAEQHHPAYDENAWKKMEGLLNEHLPQQNDRRRFFLLAFAVLLIGGGAFFFLSRPHASSNEQIVQQAKSSTGGNSRQANPNEMAPATEPATDNLKTGIAIDNTVSHNTVRKDNHQQNSVVTTQWSLVSSQMKQKDQNDLTLNSATGEKDRDVSTSKAEERKDELKQDFTQLKPDNRVTQNENAVNGSVAKKDELATNPPQAAAAPAGKTPNNNGKPSIKNGFSFFVSTGPDVSKAQNSKAGKVTMAWGLGVAYTLNRITLRTGVFSANKIYWAGPEDYKLSYAPPQNWKFLGADANCRVIEIPVKLSYNFAVNNRSNWFAGAGLSSYLMKREDYVYEYKSLTGSSYYHSYETKNENKHYFSVLDLSGGYSYQLSKTVSISAEPYVEVPLTGIGAGKVHLNSGGVLFTLGVHPFRK